MATEIFLKSFIALHRGLKEEEAIKIRHDLSEALKRCLEIQPSSELGRLASLLKDLPPVNIRYEPVQYHPEQLWNAYSLAQFTGSTVARSLTDRNMRLHLEAGGRP